MAAWLLPVICRFEAVLDFPAQVLKTTTMLLAAKGGLRNLVNLQEGRTLVQIRVTKREPMRQMLALVETGRQN